MIHAATPAEAVVLAMRQTRFLGHESAPRGMKVRECVGEQIKIRDVSRWMFDLPRRNARHEIGIIEGLQLVAQTSVPSSLTRRFRVFNNYADGGVLDGAYGIRAHGMIRRIIELIDADRDSRQAVITIFSSNRDLAVASRDVPCTLSLQFLVRDEKLHMVTTMRSNDVWKGLQYDLIQFIMLQHVISDALMVDLGTYTHNVGSLHVYATDFMNVENVIEAYDNNDGEIDEWKFRGQLLNGPLPMMVSRAEALLVEGRVDSPTAFEAYAMGLLHPSPAF